MKTLNSRALDAPRYWRETSKREYIQTANHRHLFSEGLTQTNSAIEDESLFRRHVSIEPESRVLPPTPSYFPSKDQSTLRRPSRPFPGVPICRYWKPWALVLGPTECEAPVIWINRRVRAAPFVTYVRRASKAHFGLIMQDFPIKNCLKYSENIFSTVLENLYTNVTI